MDYSLKKTNSTTFYCNIQKNIIFEEAYVFYSPAANTDSKLMQKYIQCNFQACQLIKSSLILQAIQILLSTVQQLQLSAKNGKTMNEMIIITLLNNLSHAYYQNEDYNKAIQTIRSLTYTISIINNRLSGDYSKWSKNIQLFLHFNLVKYYTYNLFISLQSKEVKPQFANVAVVRIQQSFQRFSHSLKDLDIQLSLINIKLSSSLLQELSSFLKLKEELTTDEIMQMLIVEIAKLKKLPFEQKLCFQMRKYNCESLGKIHLLNLKIEGKGLKSKLISKEIFEGGLMEFPFALFLIGKHHYFSSQKKSRSSQMNSISKARKYLLWSLYFAAKLCYFISPLHKQIFQFYDTKVNVLKESQGKKVINSLNPPILMKSSNTSWRDIKAQFMRVSNEGEVEKVKTPRKKYKKSIDKWTISSEEKRMKLRKESFRVSLGKYQEQKLLGIYKNMGRNKNKESPKKSFDQRQKNKKLEERKTKKYILITEKSPETKKGSFKARAMTSKSMSISANSWKLLGKNTRVTNDFKKHNFLEQYFPKREIDSFQREKMSRELGDQAWESGREYRGERGGAKGKREEEVDKRSGMVYSLKRL